MPDAETPPDRSPSCAKPGAGLGYDPLSAEQHENPYPVFARAHAEAPVFFSERFNLWVVTRYSDIWTVLKDPAHFSSAQSTAVSAAPPREVQQVLREGYPEVATLVTSDPPAHTRFRSLVNKAFTPRRIAEKEGRIRAIAHELIDGFAADERADFVWQFAYPLPMTVIAGILGVPPADMDRFKRWSDRAVERLSVGLPVERQVECARAIVEFQHYFEERLEERRREPRDDMLTDLVKARIEGQEPLSMAELLSILQQLLVAGNETTTHMLGSLIVLLLEKPERWQEVRGNAELAARAVEEALRMETPVQGLFRTTTSEVELGGVTLPAGAQLQLLYAAGNRDASEFPHPEAFELKRPNANAHLAFGGGEHFCLGAALARLEGRIALQVLGERLPHLRLEPGQSFTHVPHFFMRGYEHVYVRWAP
jgi:cytochrome P450